jgi:hypothetical protein
LNTSDLDAPNYKFGATSHPHLGGIPSSHASLPGKVTKKEPIDRFASIIDAEDPKFEKQRKENYKNWENSV